jgi:hypothetical protein
MFTTAVVVQPISFDQRDTLALGVLLGDMAGHAETVDGITPAPAAAASGVLVEMLLLGWLPICWRVAGGIGRHLSGPLGRSRSSESPCD